jgi:hypothetical protein
MAELPEADVTIDDEAGALAGGTDLLTVIAAVPQNADAKPRLFSSTKALLAKHGYASAVDYCAMHFDETRKPVIFIGLPIVAPGAVGRLDASGNTGTSVVSVAEAASGVLEETDGVVVVTRGGTVGTNQIQLDLSLDGGRTFKSVRIGTATSYTVPYVGLVLALTVGTLKAGETVLRWSTTAPRWDQAGLAAARAALAAQQKQSRSWHVIGDVATKDDASNVVTEVNGYETANQRFVYARAQVRDRKRTAKMSRARVRMAGSPTLTFTEVGATGDTITRSSGSWIADGFAVGMIVTIAGSASNNITGAIAGLTATVLTLGTTDLVDEGPVSNCTATASHALTFAEIGATGDTLTRSGGSWLADGFAAGDTVTIAGTASNNVSGAVTAVTETVLTFDTTDLTPEVVASYGVTVTAGELDVDWVSAIDNTFADIDGEKRIDLGAGRGRKLSPITGYRFRRPVQWAASIREYQHDVQIPTWRKADGALSGWDLEDEEGNTVEHDERIDGGLLAARFTCFRSWANGPNGAFIALSLTRAPDGSMLSRTHNLAVANVACSVAQAETENAVGQVLELNDDGTATEASLVLIEERVNTKLAIALLQAKSEGKRASAATWKASRTDVLNVPGAELTGAVDLRLKGTLERLKTRVRIQTAG